MKTIQKFKSWYRGQTPYSIGQMIGRYHQSKKPVLPQPEFEPPLIARILNPLWRFWLRHWNILLPVIVALIGIIAALFIHFDSKPK